MLYGEHYVSGVAEGLLLRAAGVDRLPDIQAQPAPNNYDATHSMAYSFDNYTNTGLQGTLAVTKNIFFQLGLTVGSDTAVWNYDRRIRNPFPNALYPGSTYKRDPGAQPSVSGCLRYQSDSGND